MTHQKQTVAVLLSSLIGLLGGVVLSHAAIAQTRLSPEPRVYPPSNERSSTPTDPSIHFIIAGPMEEQLTDNVDPTRWRLSLSCAEIYCGVEFDYIEHQQEYEGLPRIIASYWLNGADIAPLIDTDRDFLHDIHFVAWEDWNRVMLREGDRHFRIEINPDQSFSITPFPPTL